MRDSGVLPISFFFFNDTATTEIYTLSLHDALPISSSANRLAEQAFRLDPTQGQWALLWRRALREKSEEHTSEIQAHLKIVYRLPLEKKKDLAKVYRRVGHTTDRLPLHNSYAPRYQL